MDAEPSSPKSAVAPSARRSRSRTAAALALLCLLQSGLSYAWIARNGYLERPFASDAAHYRIDALAMKRGYETGGFVGWWAAGAAHDRPHPPVVVMLVGLVAAWRGDEGVSPQAAFLTLQLFGALFVLGTYRLARRFSGRGAAVAAAALAASAPLAIPNLRPLYPQFPMAALIPFALDALLATDGFRLRGRSALFGALAGLATLVKMLAPLYLVGAALGALAVGLRDRARRDTVWLNLILAAAAFAVVAGPWFCAHWDSVSGYTTAVVGGEGQKVFSSSLPVGSVARWLYYPFHFLNDGVGWLFVPQLLFGCAAGAFALVRARRAPADADPAAARRARDGALLALAPVVGYVPLTLGQTAGWAFYWLPFVPLAGIVAARAAEAVRPALPRRALWAWCGLTALFYQALAQRPPQSTPEGPALVATTDDLRKLTPLDDRSAFFLSQPAWEVTGNPDLDRHFLFEPFPQVDRYFGNFSYPVRAEPRAPGEDWMLGAMADEFARSPRPGWPRVVITTPFARPHPYLGPPQLRYEALVRRRECEYFALGTFAPGRARSRASRGTSGRGR
jgi:4-amino-4-deoxy-L-arabinose transferase-like glycosyltransferase